ncbi:hypothetical protein GCM10009595_07560 [Falsarthrobacter nasiphocae]|uniref:VapC50 C-terminal domain-containing protein n=2 Tax=Falsarthrobacter nasiphocae TaxID=189863 RepID=A0AAE3YCA4_9MICC|nr:hypothetical protein [Falsarthrobacter nasiphocae]
MQLSFPTAMVEGFDDLTDSMTNDPKDRHVLAAAVRGIAELIVPSNVKDFPRAACAPYDIDVRTPDDFLTDQLDLYPTKTLKVLNDAHLSLINPPIPRDEYLEGLEACGLNILVSTVRSLL